MAHLNPHPMQHSPQESKPHSETQYQHLVGLAAAAGTVAKTGVACSVASWAQLVQELASAFAVARLGVGKLEMQLQAAQEEASQQRRLKQEVAAADGLACPVCCQVFASADSKLFHMQRHHATYRNCDCQYRLPGVRGAAGWSRDGQ